MFFPPNLTLTEKFSQLVTGMCGALSKQSSARSFTAGPLLLLVWNRWCRMRTRFTALVARMQAGTLAAAVRVRARVRPATPRPAVAAEQPRLPSPRFGWVVRMLPEPWHLNAWRAPLEEILADPQTLALVAAGPQAGRILRSMCRMMAVELPEHLRLPARPRRPRPPRPPRPRTPKVVNSMSRTAWARFVNPEDEGEHDPRALRPPNRIGHGRSKPLIKRDPVG